jgi:AcrR family transcriptional regulator
MAQQYSGGGDISRSLALMWGYDERSGGRGPRPRLTLEAIVEQAVAVADAEGLEAVSMRRVATDLGVGTMSLYRYLPGKEELLDLMIEHVGALDGDAELSADWREAMQQMGRGLWELYTSHPWLPLVDQSRPLLGPNSLRGFDLAVGALTGTGLSGQEMVGVIQTIDAIAQTAARTTNSAAWAERVTGVSNEDFWKAQEPVLVAAMETGDYPHVAALDEDSFDLSGEAVFEFGLERVLDGIQVLVDSRRQGGS